MTVIITTKVVNEKKNKIEDKLEEPLVVDMKGLIVEPRNDLEASYPKNEFFIKKRYVILNSKAFHSSLRTTLCLFMTAVIVMSIGIFGGLCIYKLHARDQMHIFCTGWYNIPYDASNKAWYSMNEIHQNLLSDSDLLSSLTEFNEQQVLALKHGERSNENYFMERFEIDLENENYEKIDVPDFRGGRQGRFIHDFNINKTGIIDIDGQCCFVMPLNRQTVLPPHNMFDLLKKMYNGYYEVNTEIVRETMKVVSPPITSFSTVGTYIAHECLNMSIYLLQPVNEIVFKRSTSDRIYGQFAGNNIIEFNILNLDTILATKNKP